MLPELARIIEQVGREKGIDKSIVIEALESAVEAAAHKKYGLEAELEAHYNEEMGEIELFQFKTVVKEVTDPALEITVEEAHKLDPETTEGDSLGVKLDAASFGRIAAQAAKQVIIQKVREAEHSIIFGDYVGRKGEIITGIARRIERGSLVIDLGRTEARLPLREMIPGEQFRVNDRVQAYLLDVVETSYGPQIILSRACTEYVVKLFEMEVPEISDGIVSIQTAAREPGARAKIAVTSKESNVDPVGACVGMKGSRVQSIVNELKGEKIDIVPWSADPATFVSSALAPAQISSVKINKEMKSMEVVVADDQLSLAIGRRGQNVRLASKLTGWKLDIAGETEVTARRQKAIAELKSIEGVGDTIAMALYQNNYFTIDDVVRANPEQLSKVAGIGEEKGSLIHQAAQEALTKKAEIGEPESTRAEESTPESEKADASASVSEEQVEEKNE
ncbi:MAG: transcription termination/antitermination protein NusA [Deltaproteobacteria bacterium]|nr:transcription termination/antitermination protein NusA [Deltaproteobacteria bacterium]